MAPMQPPAAALASKRRTCGSGRTRKPSFPNRPPRAARCDSNCDCVNTSELAAGLRAPRGARATCVVAAALQQEWAASHTGASHATHCPDIGCRCSPPSGRQ